MGATSSDCSNDSLGTAHVTGSLQVADGSTAPGFELISSIESDTADTPGGTPLTTVSRCMTARLSVVMSYPSGPVLRPTLNPIQTSERVGALNGGGVFTLSDLSIQGGGDEGGGQYAGGSGWLVDFHGASAGSYSWISPVQWLGLDGAAHQGQITATVMVS